MSDRNVERASKIDTATLSDALDRLGLAGQCLGIKALDHGFRVAGRAYTLLYGPQLPGGTVGDYIDDVPPGDYTLSVRFTEHSAGFLPARHLTIPKAEGEQAAEPVDLGVLTLQPVE